jgi:PAS domain S-box-containing protein
MIKYKSPCVTSGSRVVPSCNPLRVSIDASLVLAWSRAVENLSDGLIFSTKTSSDWAVLYLNTEALRMFGYSLDEVVNRSIHNLLPGCSEPGAGSDDTSKEGHFGRTLSGRRRDGAAFEVDVGLAAVHQGTACAVILQLRDMSSPLPSREGKCVAHGRSPSGDALSMRVMDALCDLRESLREMDCVGAAVEHPLPLAHTRIISRMLCTLIEEIRAENNVSRAPGLSSSGAPIRVLHIEDNLSVARAIGRVLRLKGYEVFSAATREEAIRHFDVHGWRPDVILADFQLAGGSTSEIIVAEIAARLGSKPPTIVLAGTMDLRTESAAKSFADRVLIKPVDFEVLLHELNVVLNRDA